MSDVTRILSQIEQGDSSAAEQLLPLVYEELRKLASAKLVHEKPGQTLQATALVHEAYLRLVKSSDDGNWDSRGHFFSSAAEAMRRILIENARKKARLKRGANLQRIDLDAINLVELASPDQLLVIDETLSRLDHEDAEAASVVKLRYYAGLTIEQAAQALNISTRSAYRHWNFARAWLSSELLDDHR